MIPQRRSRAKVAVDEECHQVPVGTRPQALQSVGTRRPEVNLALKNRWNEPNVLRDSIVAGRDERLRAPGFPLKVPG